MLTSAPWLIRRALVLVTSWGGEGALRMARSPVEQAAIADAAAIVSSG